MTTSFEGQGAGSIPVFDTPDRLRKSLSHSGTSVSEMADYLGVTRETISRWINGRVDVSTQTLRLWALRTGVPFEWLKNGVEQQPPRPNGPNGGNEIECARRDSNSQPSGLSATHAATGTVVPIHPRTVSTPPPRERIPA